MNLKEKHNLISELIRLMRADGQERSEEMEMLRATSTFLEIPPSEFEKLLEKPLSYHPPKDEPNRIVQFYQMAMLSKADRKISAIERNYLDWLGLKMGLREEAVNAVIVRMGDNPSELLQPEEVIRIFQTFHN